MESHFVRVVAAVPMQVGLAVAGPKGTNPGTSQTQIIHIHKSAVLLFKHNIR